MFVFAFNIQMICKVTMKLVKFWNNPRNNRQPLLLKITVGYRKMSRIYI